VTHWKTKDVVELLKPLAAKVEVSEPGGDVDTENLILTAKGAKRDNHLWVCGFRLECGLIKDPADTDVENVEVKDGQDSRGGLNTDDEATCVMYGRVCSALRKKGFSVVLTLDNYF
jgi:hypothetical protein